MKLENLTRLVADGKHNAFTSMVKYKDAIYLAFRSSSGHAMSDGVIKLMRSKDNGSSWEELKSPFTAGRNFYDGLLTVFKDKLLFYSAGYDIENEHPVWQLSAREYFSESTDGENWTPCQEIIPSCPMCFWHPTVIDDYVYTASYRIFKDGFKPNKWLVYLIRSKDGLHWEFVSDLSIDSGCGNETALFWDNERLYAYIRDERKGSSLLIRDAAPPFTCWEHEELLGVGLQGPVIKEINGRRFLIGRYRTASPRLGTSFIDRGGTCLKCYVWEEKIKSFVEYLSLPSGCDCSYPGIVQLDDQRMLVSYYSQHEYMDDPKFEDMVGNSDIFLATIRTDMAAEWGRLTPGAENYLKKEGLLS